jgi:hypothetical protein
MNNKVSTIAVVLLLLLSACAPKAPAVPTTSPLDVQHTAEAAAFTMVAETQAAMPTNTSIPPTATESPTALPTLTSIPSPTADALLATPTGIPTLAPQATTASNSGTTVDNCNKPLTSWEVPTASFNIVNETKPQGKITLSLYVVTEFGECGYLADLSQGPVGSYSAGAFVDGKQSFKVFGGFQIREGNWDIVVRNDIITALGGCYPSC